MNFSFPTRKLCGSIKRITDRVKDFPNEDVVLTVYGVNNETGVSLTGKDASNDLSNYICVSGNQFVYNPYRVNIGSIGLTPKNFKGVVSPAYVVFETKNDLDSEYLLFYLKSATGNNLIRWYGNRGGVRSALRYNDLCKLDIPNLTIEEQKKSLIRFNPAQKDIKKLSRELEAQNGNIAKLRQAILQLAVQGKLVPQNPNEEPASELLKKIKAEKEKLVANKTIKSKWKMHRKAKDKPPFDIPSTWEWVRFKDVIWCFRGHNPTKSEFVKSLRKGYIRFIQITDFKTDDKAVYVPGSKKLKMVYKGEIIMAAYRHIGKVSRQMEGAFNVALCKVNEIKPIDRDFVELLIKTDLVKGELLRASERGHIPSMHSDHLLSLFVPIPPLAEQKRIVKKVDELMALCDQLEEENKQARQDSEKLMASAVHHLLHRTLPEEQAITDKKQSRTLYKDDAAVICLLLAEMEKLQRPTTEFFIQKHIFAAKHHLNLPINSLFVRKVAGPWSHELKQKVIFAAVKMNWLRWEKSRLVAGSAFEKALTHAAKVLGDRAAQLIQLVEGLKAFGNNGLERWTTVLKVVEDLKETQQPITRSNIQREINTWPGKSLKKIFAEESVDYTITMMLKHNWLSPLGKP